jgi:hypothetical protein
MDVFTLTHDLGMSQLGLGLQLIDSVQNSPGLGNEYYGYWLTRPLRRYDRNPMWPKTVYIIRHAEKPKDPHDPNLSPQGVERAQALATNCEKLFGKLDCLFAAETSAGSARSVETINPLAQTIHVENLGTRISKFRRGVLP